MHDFKWQGSTTVQKRGEEESQGTGVKNQCEWLFVDRRMAMAVTTLFIYQILLYLNYLYLNPPLNTEDKNINT